MLRPIQSTEFLTGDLKLTALIPRSLTNRACAQKFEEVFDDGITTLEINSYHYGTYRYMNVKDTIAEAKRDKAKLVDC